jgi:lantibiotic modifying enzyme
MNLSNEKIRELDNLMINISKKLSDTEYIQEVLGSTTTEYRCTSVAVSYPALCILFSELQYHFPEYKFDAYAHKYLDVINNYLGQNKIYDISLFDGLCGVGFAAHCMSANGKRYQSFIKSLNEYIVDITDSNILKYKELPLNELFYDIMYGLTGTANYLLNFKSERKVKNTLLHILQYLTDLCKIGDDGIPQFVIRADQSQLFPFVNNPGVRYVNLGVAHGIPGMLLVLSKSYELGIYVQDQLEAIKYLSEYIFNSCAKNSKEIFWQTQKIIGIDNDITVPSRDAWCYGTPGVAYSLLIASKILDDNEMRNLAIDSMKLSLKRMREVISPTFCHGLSGLCCLARKFYEYTNDTYFHEMYMKVFEHILDLYSDEYPFGFKDMELEKGQIVNKDEIGLLTGASGVILTILSCYKPVKTQWDSIFLL